LLFSYFTLQHQHLLLRSDDVVIRCLQQTIPTSLLLSVQPMPFTCLLVVGFTVRSLSKYQSTFLCLFSSLENPVVKINAPLRYFVPMHRFPLHVCEDLVQIDMSNCI
jgi:hypothetical protein